MIQQKTIWTIGHSNLQFKDFVTILKLSGIKLVADIRSLPGSKKYPHFNKETLMLTLPENGIEYVHMIELGGRRKPSANSVNTRWRLDSFRGYADYMETESFVTAIEKLQSLASGKEVAYMCAESLWWKCHRSLVSDYLKFAGWKVIHIMSNGKSTEHSYTQPARIVNGRLTYSDADH